LISLCAASSSALADPVEYLPLDQIRPGQTGYGLTVFRGFKVERFQVKVVDVLRNFLPKQDLFLIMVDHPVLRKTGVVGGMSGSPIYIKGKLAGALAYGWRFSKEPIAGVTPIKNMLDLLKRKIRGPARAGWASSQNRPTSKAAAAPAPATQRLDRPLPAASYPPISGLTPMTVPLSAAGWSPEALNLLRESFSGFGFEPVQGGGTGKAEGPAKFQAGGALGIQLVSGDISLTGTGTVTWTDGKRVLGFGHRMLNAGEIYLPTTTAKIVHTLASLARSFKISSPARTMGSLVQDRQAGVMVDSSRQIGAIPMKLTMRTPTLERVYNVRLARHRILSSTLARTVVANGVSEALTDVAHATFTMRTTITLKDHRPLKIVEHLYASSGVRLPVSLFSRGIGVIAKVLDNPYQPVEIQRINVDLDVKFARDLVQIEGLQVNSARVRPGSRINLLVTFKPFAGYPFTKAYPLQIPATMAGSVLSVEVASGALAKPDLAPPQNLKQYLKNLQQVYPSRSVVVSLKTPSIGLKVQGRIIKDLPPSVADALRSGTRVRDEKFYSTELRTVHGTRRIVTGKKSLRIRVEPLNDQ